MVQEPTLCQEKCATASKYFCIGFFYGLPLYQGLNQEQFSIKFFLESFHLNKCSAQDLIGIAFGKAACHLNCPI